MGRAVGAGGFLSVGSAEEEGMQGARPVRQGAGKEAGGLLSQPSSGLTDRAPHPRGCMVLVAPGHPHHGSVSHPGLFPGGWGHSHSGDHTSSVSSAFPPEMTCKHSLAVRIRPPSSQAPCLEGGGPSAHIGPDWGGAASTCSWGLAPKVRESDRRGLHEVPGQPGWEGVGEPVRKTGGSGGPEGAQGHTALPCRETRVGGSSLVHPLLPGCLLKAGEELG